MSVKSSISSHVRIPYQFVTTRYTTDFYKTAYHASKSNLEACMTVSWEGIIKEQFFTKVY